MINDEHTFRFDGYKVEVTPIATSWSRITITDLNGSPILMAQDIENHLVCLAVLQALDRSKRLNAELVAETP
jgi:hypothetical protein